MKKPPVLQHTDILATLHGLQAGIRLFSKPGVSPTKEEGKEGGHKVDTLKRGPSAAGGVPVGPEVIFMKSVYNLF